MKKFLCLIFALILLVVTIPYASAESEELPLLERYDRFSVNKKFESTPLTYEAWICIPKNLTSQGVILGNLSDSATVGVNFEVKGDGAPRLRVKENTTGSVVEHVVTFSNVSVRTGNLVHLAIVYNPDNEETLCYVNGELKATQTGALNITDEICDYAYRLAGDRTATNWRNFNGSIKEITIYSDVRSAEEIKADMSDINILDPALIAWYGSIGEAEINSVIKDMSGNGYDVKRVKTWIPEKEEVTDYAYSFCIVGDTQMVNSRYPKDLAKIYDWILANKDEKNIKFVFGLGDVTDTDTDTEWKNAKEQIVRMDGVIPYSLVRGNHDSSAQINKYFANDVYMSQFGGFFEDGKIENSWKTIEVDNVDYLLIAIDDGPTDAMLEWAAGVIEAHPNHKVIISTHGYLNDDCTRLKRTFTDATRNDGEQIWEKLVSKYKNIFLLLSGHDVSENVVYLQSKGIHGNTVTQMLIDPQTVDIHFQSTGMVTMLYFSEDGNTVEVEQYSTVKNMFFMSESQYTLPLVEVDYSLPVADTFVSAIDIAVTTPSGEKAPASDKSLNYGKKEELMVSGGSSDVGERVALISYYKESIENCDNITLNLTANNNTSSKVNVYVLDNYKINEGQMNYSLYETNVKNKMTFVTTATLSEGINALDISSVADKVSGDFFTLIITAADNSEHIYVADFEKWESGTHGNDGNVDASYTSYFRERHADSWKSDVGDYLGYGSSRFYVRGGSPLNNYASVVADPDGSDNNVLEYIVQGSEPRMKFLNTLIFDPFTKDDIGDTYRITFRMKAIAEDGNTTYTQTSTMGVMRVNGISMEENSSITNNNANAKIKSDGKWVEFTYDYVVNESDLTTDKSTGKYNDPIFTIKFASRSATPIHYYIDDISVIKLDSDGKEPIVSICSLEDSESSSATIDASVSNVCKLDGNISVIEATVSCTSSGDVISIVDDEKIYSLLCAENQKLVFGNIVLCDKEGNDIILTNTPVKAVAIYDDTKGSVRFAVGENLAYYKDAKGNVCVTYEHIAIDGGISPKATLGVNGTTAYTLKSTTSEIIGFQTNYIDRAVRFVSGVDVVYYNEVGFKLETDTTEKTLGSTVVYSSIIGDDKNIYASQYGYNLMSAVSITDIKTDGIVKITPFLRVGTNYIYGEAVYYEITVNDKAITVVETE